MQSVEPSRGAARPARGPLSPVVAFVALIAVLALLGSIIFLTRPDTAKPPAPLTSTEEETHFALTDEEAMTRFEELEKLLIGTYLDRDPTLLSAYLAPESPLLKSISKDVQQLRRDRVIDATEFNTKRLQVISNEESEIVIRQVVTEDPSFLDERTGKDISSSQRTILETIDWTLRLESDEWLIFNSDVLRSRFVKQ